MNRLEFGAWVAAAACIVLAGFWWDGHHKGAAAAKPKIEAASDNAAARTLEAQGAQAINAKTEALLTQAVKTQERTDALVADLRSRPAVSGRLDSAVAGRLRDHDQFLCDSDPGACAPAAAAPAPDGH